MRIKIGSLEILAERTGARPQIGETGASGTQIFAGVVCEEYNSDLKGPKAIAVYDKMRKSDARVKAAILVCELPLRSVEWHVQPGSDSSKDRQIAEELEQNIYSMTITWDSFLHHAFLMLPFGFSIFEKVWEIKDGRVRYRKLAPRMQKTLCSWGLDDTGGLESITQYAMRGDKWDFFTIPSDKLLVFTNEKEGSNFEGTSILRTAYKHWYYKDNLYRIDGIAAERQATGVPFFQHPTTAQDSDKQLLDQIGMHLQAHERQYVRLPEDYTFDIKGVTGTIRDIMPSIEHHNRAISESVLADFLNLGDGKTGSWALSKDKSSFFLMSLAAIGENICDTFNAYAIPQWVSYNYGPVENLPKLEHTTLETRNMKEYAEAVTGLLQSGGLVADIETENTLRDMLGMPEKQADIGQKVFKGAEFRRELTPAEQNVNFSEIEQTLDDTEQDFIDAVRDVRARQITNLADEVAKILQSGNIEKLNDLDVRYKAEMANQICKVLHGILKYGRKQVRQELKVQKNAEIPEDDAGIVAFLRIRSTVAASTVANKIKASAIIEGLRQVKSGIIDSVGLKQKLKDLSDRELASTAGYSISEAFNYGRSLAAQDEQIDRVQYSALLDINTCSECAKLDGAEWPADTPEVARYAGGNPNCLGGGRCRCMLVYILKRESRGG